MGKYKYLFDGAFGTYYHQLTGSSHNCETANITNPAVVLRIHREYINAGANAIKTNTFRANSKVYTDASELKEIIKKGFDIASEAAKQNNASVFADIGNIYASEDTANEYISVASAFIECGAQNFLFETLKEADPVVPAVKYIKSKLKNSVVILSFAVSPDGYTYSGKDYRELIETALAGGADIVGLNCVCGPSYIYELIKRLDLSGLDFSAMPNSGYPAKLDGRLIYSDNPDYFADKLCEIQALGVNTLGGCCGTTPEHIKKIANKLKASALRTVPEKAGSAAEIETSITESPLKQALDAGKFAIAVEVDPPLNTDMAYMLDAANNLKARGADVLTLADSPLARARADSIMVAAKLKRDTGLDVLPHLTCRDRNSIAIKGALLAANMEDIQNLLVVTGDGIDLTSGGKQVYNFNSIKLISYIESMNRDVFPKKPFYICAALNVNAANFKAELNRAQSKLENGAQVLFTQPVFTREALANLMLAKAALKCKLMAGILPVAGYKNAVFLNNEVPGMTIPGELIKRLEGKSKESESAISLEFCYGIIDMVRNMCDGLYLITPLKKLSFVYKLVEYINN